jgi:hypothetical protein
MNALKNSIRTLLSFLLISAFGGFDEASALESETPIVSAETKPDVAPAAPPAIEPTPLPAVPSSPPVAPAPGFPPPVAPPANALPAAPTIPPVVSPPSAIPPSAPTAAGKPSTPPVSVEPAAPAWQTTPYLLRLNLGMSGIGNAKIGTSGGLEIVLQGPILAFSLGLQADELPSSLIQYAVFATPILRLVIDNDDFFIGPRVGYVTITSSDSRTSITGGEYGFTVGYQWGSGNAAFGILFVMDKVVYNKACSDGTCVDVTMLPAKCSRLLFTLAF